MGPYGDQKVTEEEFLGAELFDHALCTSIEHIDIPIPRKEQSAPSERVGR